MARGIITIPDNTSHIPGEITAVPMDQSATPTTPAAIPTPEIAAPPLPDATPPASMVMGSDPSLVAASKPADWAATSVTIVVSE
jgi:hypothetical protein